MANPEDKSVEGRTAAVPAHVKQVAPGIPAVEVDPTNELLDGENLDEKVQMLAEEPVKVDASGRRLVHIDAENERDVSLVPPPQSANLELRKGLAKGASAFDASIGRNQPEDTRMADALREEKRGLQGRADGGDDRAAKRVEQVDEQLHASNKSTAAAKRSEQAGGTRAVPQGRSSRPTTTS